MAKHRSRAQVLASRRGRGVQCIPTPKAGRVCVGDVVLVGWTSRNGERRQWRGIVRAILPENTLDIAVSYEKRAQGWNVHVDNVLQVLGVTQRIPGLDDDRQRWLRGGAPNATTPLQKWENEARLLRRRRTPAAQERLVKIDHLMEEYQRQVGARRHR